jgi:UPF0716 protein FxsA
MVLKLFLAFTIIPIIEIYLLMKIGGRLGAETTILIVIVTGITGAYLAKQQGLRTVTRIRNRLDSRELPAGDLVDALLIFAAGVVLLTPGFVTDVAGLMLLVPPIRSLFKRYLRRRFERSVKIETVRLKRRNDNGYEQSR